MKRKPTYDELAQKIKKLEKKTIQRDHAAKQWIKFMNSVNDWYVLLDSKLNVIAMNKSGVETFFPSGTTKKEIIGKNFLELVPEIKTSGRDKKLMRVIKTGQPYYEDNIVARHNKSKKKFHIHITAHKIDSGLGIVATDITKQKNAEYAIHAAQDKLEDRVKRRTSALMKSNEKLKKKIEEHRKAQKELQLSEEKYRMLADNVSDVIWATDIDLTRYLYVSPSIESLNGFTQEEAINKSIEENLTPASFEYAAGILAEELAKEKTDNADPKRTRTLELEEYRKDGSTIWTEVTTRFLRGEKGKVIGILGTTRDISDRKKAQDNLKDSEEKYRVLVEHVGSAVVYYNPEGRVLFLNKMAAAQLGGKPKDFAGKTVYDIFPEIAEDMLKNFSATIKSGKGKRFEASYAMPGKSRRYYSTNIQPVKDKHAGIVGIQVVATDITEQKIAENALRESEEKFKTIFENSTDAIAYISKDGFVIDVNKKVGEFFGYAREEVVGRKFADFDLFDSVRMKETIVGFEGILDGKMEPRLEYEIICKSGQTIYVEAHSALIEKDGKIEGVLFNLRDISRRKVVLDALRESEEKFRTIFKNANDEILYMDVDGTVIDVNDKVEEIFGFKRKEVVGKHFSEFHFLKNKEDMVKTVELFNQIATGGEPQMVEFEIIRKDGASVYVEANPRVITKDGKVQAIMAIIRDVTERKKAEETIRASEEKYRMLFENSPLGIMHWNKDGIATSCNTNLANMIGATLEQIIGVDLHKALHDPVAKKNILSALSGELRIFESEYISPRDKSVSILKAIYGPIYSIDDKINGCIGIIQDITEQKKSEDALRESEERFKTIFENANDVIVYVRPDGTVIDANNKIEEFGYKRGEVIGRKFTEFEIFRPDGLKRSIKTLNRTLGGKPVQMMEIEIFRKDKTMLYVEVNSALIEKDGGPIGIINIIRDITDRKQAEEALRKSEEKFKMIFESASDGIIYVSVDGTVIDLNYKMEELFGYERNEVIGKKFSEFRMFGAKDNQKTIDIFKKIIVGMFPPMMEFEAYHKDGSKIYIEVNAKKIVENGEITGLLNIIRDISKRRKAEEERARLIDIIEATSDFVSIADIKGNIIYINQAGRDMVGIGRNEDVTKTEISQYHPRWIISRVLDEGVSSAINEGVWSGETALMARAGREFPASQVIMSHKNIDGDVIFLSTIIRDITQQKQYEEHIHALTQQLIKAQEDERQRISRDLHDNLAQDLSTLKISFDTFFDHYPSVEEDLKTKALDLSRKIQGTIAAVRDLTYGLRPPSLDQLGLVRTLYQFCEDFSEKTGIVVDFSSAGMENLKPGYDTEINLYRMTQESMNNIRKHAEATRVTIRLVASYPKIILRIEDNGKGFNVKRRLAKALKEKRMGLQSMEERARLLRGHFGIQSGHKTGTKILIEVPLEEMTT